MGVRWFAGLLILCSVSGAAAQAVYVQGGLEGTTIECGDGSWAETGIGIGLDGDRSDAFLQASRSSRCGDAETRFLADLYQTLTSGTYANLQVVLTPGAVRHPGSDVLVELYRGIGKGYESSLQVRQMRYPGTTATIVAPSVARYLGKRYYRLQLLGAKAGDTPLSVAATASIRTYRGEVNYFEVRAGAGREVIDLPGTLLVSLGYSVGLSANSTLGRARIMPGAGWAYDQQLGGRGTFGLRLRSGSGVTRE